MKHYSRLFDDCFLPGEKPMNIRRYIKKQRRHHVRRWSRRYTVMLLSHKSFIKNYGNLKQWEYLHRIGAGVRNKWKEAINPR
jgi:hypothetical protein